MDSSVIVMGDNLTAVDSTAARIMGFYPEQIQYLQLMLPHGGTINESLIRQLGEPTDDVQRIFNVLPHVKFIAEKPSLWKQAMVSGW